MEKGKRITVDLKEYRKLLDLAFAAKSVLKYQAMEGDTFDFMVECGMNRIAKSLKKLDI